jgi:hypothetical protein
MSKSARKKKLEREKTEEIKERLDQKELRSVRFGDPEDPKVVFKFTNDLSVEVRFEKDSLRFSEIELTEAGVGSFTSSSLYLRDDDFSRYILAFCYNILNHHRDATGPFQDIRELYKEYINAIT